MTAGPTEPRVSRLARVLRPAASHRKQREPATVTAQRAPGPPQTHGAHPASDGPWQTIEHVCDGDAMAGRTQVLKRERRRVEAQLMTEAAAHLRNAARPSCAGLSEDGRDATAGLLEEIAATPDSPSAARVWEQAARVAVRVLEPSRPTRRQGPTGPAPAGHTPPKLDRTDRPLD